MSNPSSPDNQSHDRSDKNKGVADNDQVESAFEKFFEAWFAGKKPDPKAFVQEHPELGSKLQGKIDDFLFVVMDLSNALSLGKNKPDPDLITKRCVGRVIGDFRIIRPIGTGGMGIVFEAEQVSLKRKVALKILSPQLGFSDKAVLKFKREAEAGGRQHHPGIAEIYTVGVQDGIHYIAQELVEGGQNLFEYLDSLRSDGTQPSGYFRHAAKLIHDVADALEHAHASGVIHRDIKPSNIMITSDGSPKVTDFGLARVEDAISLSRTGEQSGTPCYMSPEQAVGARSGLDKRTDVYSLGVTLYEMLTLEVPFKGDSSFEIFKKILQLDPKEPHKTNPHVPRDLSVICLKALEKQPEHRYPSMKEFADDLNRFLQGDVIHAQPATLSMRTLKRVKRNPIVSALICIALVSLLGLVGYILWAYPQLKRAIAEKEEQRLVAEENYKSVIRLSDKLRITELKTEANDLWPAYPENISSYKEWITRCENVTERFNIHHETLLNLREKALENNTEEAWSFKDKETQWQHDYLSLLIKDIHSFQDPENGLLRDMNDRLAFASTIQKISIDDQRKAWNRAIDSIANPKECPRYNGLEIPPQIGLVPIGRDKDSGLWEFWCVQTGEKPERGADDRLLLTEQSGMVFVLLPGGTFNMGAVHPSEEHPEGSPNIDPQADPDEGPVHSVTLKPFFLSKYEMTQGQWLRFAGNNPSNYKEGFDYAGLVVTLVHPIEYISWKETVKLLFCLGLRLPSESEWEYAARAGTSTPWWTGSKAETLQGAINSADLFCKNNGGPEGWIYEDFLNDGNVIHAPVDSFRANGFGLHNMCGNVWEWCQDLHMVDGEGNSAGYSGAPDDGSAWIFEGRTKRIKRGGSSGFSSFMCRSSVRGYDDESGFMEAELGCRPARSLDV